MESSENLFKQNQHIQAAATGHQLSTRAARNFVYRDIWGPREKLMGNPWSLSNPSGPVILRLAENSLLHGDVVNFISEQMTVRPSEHLTYSTGPRGSRRLRSAAATFLTKEFQAKEEITADNIFITPGLAGAIDSLAWAICNEGDGILIPQPLYNGFSIDILNRSNVRVVGVTYEGIEGYSKLDDVFRVDVNKIAIESAFRKAERQGIPPETLKEFASFCGRHRLHFIADEIYAKSVFLNPAIPSVTHFSSTLALDLCDVIDPTRTHVLYGASKDFCANGLRLGLICTRNEGIIGAISSIGILSWPSHILQDIWAAMLEDTLWTQEFMLKKRKAMAEQYRFATSFLFERGVRYYEMNAGLCIWVDLRHLLISKSSFQLSDYSALRVTSPNASVYKQRELRIAEICGINGVIIAPGHVYMAEEFGWFRVTFTVEEQALKEGLTRFWRSLMEAQAEIQG
ncbi:pyridoxal phosphate-dependent transferase [Bisporella sp. PMI_857]|nr:pyridoxal phosphate-dependent transferase [Bisporella sp. PMI_857]